MNDLLSLFLPDRRADKGPTDDFWYRPVGRHTTAGVPVDENSAMNYSAVACATRIISETSAQLPLKIYEHLDNGGRKEASDFSLYDLLHDAPNYEMGSMAFRDSRTAQQANYGNAYAEIERSRQEIINLWPIHSSRVTPYRETDGSLWYAVRNNDGTSVKFPMRDILHVPGAFSEDGICGRGIISMARESIGFGLATERHGAAFFGNGARPSGILSHPQQLSENARANLRNEWKLIHGGPENAGEVAILQEGMTYDYTSLSNEDAQFLATRQHNVTEIARWYRIPPHMLADLLRSTNNNIEFQGMEFVVYSLMPWLKRWEEALTLRLLTRPQRRQYFIEHNVSGLLRGDIKSRYEAYKTGISYGWLSVNDICRMENLNPIGPSGDEHFGQMNTTTLDRIVSGEAVAPAPAASSQAQEAMAAVASLMGQTQTTIASGFENLGAKVDDTNRNIESDRETILGWISEGLRAAGEDGKRNAENAAATEAVKDGARDVLLDAMRRMIHREATEAVDATGKPTKFLAWIDDFYLKHEQVMREAMSPAVRMCQAAGYSLTVDETVGGYVRNSKDTLLELTGRATADNLGNIVAGEMKAWRTTRAGEYVNKLLSDKARAA